MSKALEVIGLPGLDQVQFRLRAGEETLSSPPVPFSCAMHQPLRREMAWYFQEYPDDPFGASKTRAQQTEASFRSTGREMFEAIFKGSQDTETHYSSAASRGLADHTLKIISDDPSFLGLPWELLNDPGEGYLAGRFSALVRQWTHQSSQFSAALPAEQLNVLLVSPAPVGHDSSASLAWETAEALDSLDVHAALDCLSPPTFAAFSQHLSANQGQYHLVLFDGLLSSAPDSLLFESADGEAEHVSAASVAEVLAGSGVPMAMLSTGGAQGSDLPYDWAVTATCLASGGVPQVVSLSFPLPSPGRKLFLRPFFEAVARGCGAPEAVAKARRALMDQPSRHSPAGEIIFWDWISPVVFQSQTYTPAPIEAPAASQSGFQVLPQENTATQEDPLPQGGVYGLVGRRGELRHLERLFFQGPVVLLSGPIGVGKTELALGLARWLSRTRARPGGVFYTSFDVGAGVERVIHEVGTSIAGLDFADMTAQQQRNWVVEYLGEHPSLLILDRLENVDGFPAAGSGLLDESERAQLDDFLGEVAKGGQTWVLLVGRREQEQWVRTPFLDFRLAGLHRKDALELGNEILRQSGTFESLREASIDSRMGPDYFKLLELLEGHPLAMQVCLPLLKEAPASILEQEITRRTAELYPADGEEARPPYLTAVMDAAFSRLSRRSRTHLPFLSLFQRRVLLDILTHITQEQVYRSVMGEELGWGACRTLLRSARDSGFMERVTPSVYQIHPAFPWFYGRQLHRQVSAEGVGRLEQEFLRVYTDTADYFMESLYEDQEAAATAILAEEANLSQAIGLGLEAKDWDSVQVLVQPLAQVYKMQKRRPELQRLRRKLLSEVTPNDGGAAVAQAAGGIDLWLYLVGTEASEAVEFGELDYGEELNRQLLDYLSAQPYSGQDPRVAAVNHQLGVIAQRHRRLEEAGEWFLKSLAIIEDGEDKAAVADDYHSLGQVKQHQQLYAEAQEWFKKSLEIHQALQDPEEMVNDYRALGRVSQFKLEYDEAESWYQQARAVVEEHRDEETAILVYHELATVYHARYLFDQAESWFRQALYLSDQLGKPRQMAVEFHHLGRLAQNRGLLYEDAENWYLLALEKFEELGDRRSAGDQCRQLGVLFHEQQKLDEAEQWYSRAADMFDEVGDVQRSASTYGQLAVLAEDRGDLAAALEWAGRTYSLVVDHDLPLLSNVKSHLGRLRRNYGADPFAQWWRGTFGGDPPVDLDAEP